MGYVPYDVKINENTARTLEYAYDDWCIYQMAKALNRPKKELKLFADRAMNYKNVFDKESHIAPDELTGERNFQSYHQFF